VSIEVHAIYLMAVVVTWLVAYHAVYWLTALVRDPSLICWSVGLLGLRVVPLREPSLGQRLTQLLLAGTAVAALAYATLFVIQPSPLAGLDQAPSARALAVAIPVVALTLWRLLAILRERRFPLWGEARVMAAVQRSRATGALVVFTPAGRAFLRERFGATPHEFLRMVRY
jgi:hypothetical protein